jgi:hypothetical protein
MTEQIIFCVALVVLSAGMLLAVIYCPHMQRSISHGLVSGRDVFDLPLALITSSGGRLASNRSYITSRLYDVAINDIADADYRALGQSLGKSTGCCLTRSCWNE